ncbi:hypothetical protein NCC49_003191 [Naganishia albida]|nr:hypothetical protein NCC49_003191 [Naganishia albida]
MATSALRAGGGITMWDRSGTQSTHTSSPALSITPRHERTEAEADDSISDTEYHTPTESEKKAAKPKKKNKRAKRKKGGNPGHLAPRPRNLEGEGPSSMNLEIADMESLENIFNADSDDS